MFPLRRSLAPLSAKGGVAAVWAPTDKSGLQLWLHNGDPTSLYTDAARTTLVSSDGDVIGGVADKSGGGHHQAQSTTSKKSLYKTAIQNGRSVGRWDGSDDWYDAFTAISLTGDFTVAFALKVNNAGLLYAWGTGGPLMIWSNEQALYDSGFTKLTINNVWTIGAFFVVIVTRTSGARKVYVNGVDKTAVGLASDSTSHSITRLLLREDAAFPLSGDLGEALIWNSAPTAGELTSLQTYLQGWGTF